MTKFHPVPTIVIAGIIAANVSGCVENLSPMDLAVQAAGDSLVVTFCTEVRATNISMSERESAWAGPGEKFVSYEGPELRFANGDKLVPGQPTEVELIATPLLDPGSELYILMLGSSSDYETSGDFVIPEAGLSETLWLHPNGTETALPC